MNEPANTPIAKRSELMRFLRWASSWPGIRRMLIILTWIATIIALLYAEENWRGRRAWNNYRQQLVARGVQLDLASFIPKPIPDEQNFAANRFVESWFAQKVTVEKRWDDNFAHVNKKAPQPWHMKNGQRRLIDLVAWQMACDAIRSNNLKSGQRFESHKLDRDSRAKAAPLVLDALTDSETNLAPLRAVSQRPYCRYPVVYDLNNPWGILIPHIPNVRAACVRLDLRACAELAAGQSDRAFEDLRLAFYLADSLRQEFFLTAYVNRLGLLQETLHPLWEGLVEHRWSDGQLQQFQTLLHGYDLLGDSKPPLDGERAAGVLTPELLYQQKYHLRDLMGGNDSDWFDNALAEFFALIAPHGWYHLEQYNYCRLYDNQLRGTFDAAQRRVFPKQIQAGEKELERELSARRLGRSVNAVLHHELLVSMLLPALSRIPFRAASAQTAIDQAFIACALERYRLAKSEFPEKLEPLAPAFAAQLPNDILSGQPYKYRRLPNGQFILYSVGWDEKDDGGIPDENLNVAAKLSGQDAAPGDWVWQSFPAEAK